MLEVKKQSRETSQSLVRRFGRRVQQSGILLRARAVRFYHRPKSKESQKKTALRKQELKKKYEQLRKLGKLE